MYAGPSKGAVAKAICPSCHFRALFRPLSSSAPSAAKRARTPRFQTNATSKGEDPYGYGRQADGTTVHVAAKLGKHNVSMEFLRGLRGLGFRRQSYMRVVDVLRVLANDALVTTKLKPNTAFAAMSTQRRFLKILEGYLDPEETALLSDPPVLRKALHLLGISYYTRPNKLWSRGLEILQTVFMGGETDAAIDAAAAEVYCGKRDAEEYRYIAPGMLHTPQVYEFIKTQALSKADWRAMTLYLDEMSRITERDKAARDHFDLATELYGMLEPTKANRTQQKNILLSYKPPWTILYDAAKKYIALLSKGAERDRVQKQLEIALYGGIYKYSDDFAIGPALRQPNVIRTHSPVWFELAEQCAGKGNKDGALELATYHLRKAGWRPQKHGKKPTDWTGIEWLGVAAAASQPDTAAMVNMYFGLAHLLWEHGHRAEGRSWMETAKENVVEAGLDPRGEWEQAIDKRLDEWTEVETDKPDLEKYMNKSDEYLVPYLDEKKDSGGQLTFLTE